MENNTPVKRGRGRPKKWTEDNPKPKIDEKNPLEVIREPQRTNTPLTAMSDAPPGDNTKYTTFALAIAQMPEIDLKDPRQLSKRVNDYFQLCADMDMKPGITAAALALGMDRRRLWEINTDCERYQAKIPPECKAIIKKLYTSMELLWETWMQNGKINPVSGIFLGKNNFGYKDQQEYVLTPNQMGEAISQEALEAKYEELPDE